MNDKSRPTAALLSRAWRLLPDGYICAILGTVLLASVFPCRGEAAHVVKIVTNIAIGLLFFLYGVRLAPQAVWQGIAQWRLQLLVFASTFVLFPILGWGVAAAAKPWLGPAMASGVLFLSLLPSTVQSSIAFTSIARGNVAAALCAASLSNLVGMVITPAMVAVIMGLHGSAPSQEAKDIIAQLFLPFVAGQLLRRWLAPPLQRHRQLIGYTDRGSILLVVYSAFSASVAAGLWHQVSATTLVTLFAVNIVLLAVVLLATWEVGKLFGFSREDRIVLLFCGSKKSLASGVPMAGILFPAAQVGAVVLPIMLFHQIQLMACAWLARRFASQHGADGGT